jgi:hypothetical protein
MKTHYQDFSVSMDVARASICGLQNNVRTSENTDDVDCQRCLKIVQGYVDKGMIEPVKEKGLFGRFVAWLDSLL